MASCRILFYCAFLLGGFLLATSNAQISSRSFVTPSIIRNCYQNTTAFIRYRRQPMHIENLITIIRKIEHKKPLWDMRRIARTVVKGFQFDGVKFDANARPDLQFSQAPAESVKTGIIHKIIPSPDENLEEDVLDNDERCALHWMLSYSMNATMRDDEETERYGRSGFLRARRAAQKPGMLDLESDNDPDRARRVVRQAAPRQTRWPIETGVVLTKWGSISAGRVIAGIAAGLEPQSTPVVYVPMARDAVLNRGGSSGGNYPPNSNPNGVGGSSGGSFASYPSGAAGSGNYPNQNNPGSSGGGGSYQNTNNAGNTGVGVSWSAGGNSGSAGAGIYPNNQGNSGAGGNWPPGNAVPLNPNNSGGSSSSNNRQPFGKRRKRQVQISFEPLENLHAATLAGEVGQAAILNAKFSPKIQNKSPPHGVWNDTICPREHVLSALQDSSEYVSNDHDTWSYMTAAEVRGGLDGVILGSKIFEWERLNVNVKLSQILEMYYSENGIASEPLYRACERSSLYNSAVPSYKLVEQGKSFAYLFNSEYKEMAINDDTASAFLENVNIAEQKLSSYARSLSGMDPQCRRKVQNYGPNTEIQDIDKYTVAKTTVYAVLDHSVATREELRAQQRLLGQLAYEFDVSLTGSRIGLADGRGGPMLISPNWTDNAAVLACKITDQEPYLQNQDLVSTLRSIKSELQKERDLERRDSDSAIGVGNGIVILIFVQAARLDDNRRGDIRYALEEIDNEFDVRIVYASSTLNEADFSGVTLNEESYDFIKIRGSQNISDDSVQFTEEFLKKTHGRLYYSRCDQIEYDQSEEYTIPNNIWVSPGNIQYYRVSPIYFFSNMDLRMRFTSDRGKVRVCTSRDNRYPNSINGAECYETSGTYAAPGGNERDLEFVLDKPCKNRKRSGCGPIYFSVTPTQVTNTGAAGVDCTTYGCETPDQIKVTWSHWNMRCGAMRSNISSLAAILTTLLSVFSFYKYV